MSIKNTNERKSNFELMRIVSMIFIIIYHIIFHICSIYSYQMSSMTFMILRFIIAIVIVHVNSFIIISGYFQCNKEFKLSKVIKLNNITWFYGVLFLVLALILSKYYGFNLTYPIKQIDIYKTLVPLDYGNYWFIDLYLLLYIFTPVLNKVIKYFDKKGLLKIIIVLFIIFSIIPTLTVDGVVYTNEGHSILIFILLYFIGAYLRLYPISENKLLSKYSNTARKTFYFIMFIFMAFISLLFYNMSVQLGHGTSNEIIKHFSEIFFNFYNSFGSPIIIIQSIFYFLFFSTISLKSKIINIISKCVFGIYLIHENIYIRDNFYKLIPWFKTKNFGYKHIGMIFVVALLMFITCIIIDLVRKVIFKMISKLKISRKIVNSFKNYFNNLGLRINW